MSTDPEIHRARLAQDVVFVLVSPQTSANVGAVARAMRNMGLERLIIADPSPSFDPQRARWMAKGAVDLIDGMKIVATLDEALEGAHRVVASTARHRRDGQPVVEPDALAEQILDDAPGLVTAILFGREDTGLTREEVHRCESLLRIATDEHASLNLGQAALLIGHDLFQAARRRGMVATGRTLGGLKGTKQTAALQAPKADDAIATVTELEPAVTDLLALLDRIGYTRSHTPEKVTMTLRGALQHGRVARKNVHTLRGMVARVQFALDHPGEDWRKKSGS